MIGQCVIEKYLKIYKAFFSSSSFKKNGKEKMEKKVFVPKIEMQREEKEKKKKNTHTQIIQN